MNAQAEQLRDYVGDLVQLVTGKKDQDSVNSGTRSIKPVVQQPSSTTGKNKMLAQNTNVVQPDQVIPFDDDENFKDF